MSEVVVLVPHYNDLPGLHRSLASISDCLAVDVLIVDDGSSTKPVRDDLRRTYGNIHDIIVLHSEPNRGQPFVENIGLDYIHHSGTYRYVARLDAGDTCVPQRFVLQKQYLDEHPNVAMVGSHAAMVDMQDRLLTTARMPLEHRRIVRFMHSRSCFVHSSVMFRPEAVRAVGNYPVDYFANDDYALWFRFIRRFATANLDSCLVNVQINPASLSRARYRRELRSRMRLLLANFSLRFPYQSIVGLAKASVAFVVGARIAAAAYVAIGRACHKEETMHRLRLTTPPTNICAKPMKAMTGGARQTKGAGETT